MLKSRVDPMKVAELDGAEFSVLFNAAELIMSNQELPDCLLATSFRIMRKVGANVKSTSCMKIAAVQLQNTKRLIYSLRTHNLP